MYFGIKSKQKGGKERGANGGGMGGKEKEGKVEDGGGEGYTIVYIVAASLYLWLQDTKSKTSNNPYYNLP